jgi:hypothetical protein
LRTANFDPHTPGLLTILAPNRHWIELTVVNLQSVGYPVERWLARRQQIVPISVAPVWLNERDH